MSFGWIVLGVLSCALILFLIMVLGTLAHLREVAGELTPFDMRPGGYSVAEAQALLLALGDAGRGYYLNVQQRLDLVYPALYGLSRALVIWWLTMPGRLVAGALPMWVRIVMIVPPIGAMIFDYAENIAVGAMLEAGPTAAPAAIEWASAMTRTKSLFGAVTEVSALLLAALAAARWWWHRRNA